MKPLHIIAASMLALGPGLSAQELNSEFTVTHQVVPEERAATRLQLLPQLQLPAVNAGRLPASGLVTPGQLSPSLITLEPAPWLTTLARSPWRGYAQLAYGPTYNLDASAGYRIIDRSRLQLNAYMQFNGFKYSAAHPDTPWRVYGKPSMHRNTVTAATNLSWSPLDKASLRVAADYSFSAYNIPMPVVARNAEGWVVPDAVTPTVVNNHVNHNGVNVTADWAHAVSTKFSYSLSAAYGMTSFSRMTEYAHTENRGSFGANLRYDHGEKSHWALALSALSIQMPDFGHKGVLSVAPAYRLTLRRFTAQIGVKADFRLGNVRNADDNTDGWLYPQVDLCWKPSSMFSLRGVIDGRTDANSMASLFEGQPYNFPANYSPVSYGVIDLTTGESGTITVFEPLAYSRVYTFDAMMTIGPWKGASITLFGGLGFANDWLIPSARTGFWQARDVSGGHYGASFDYSWRQYLALSARAEFSTAKKGDFDSGYYLWRDHARMDLTVSAATRPISPLYIKLAYHLRTGRAKEMPAGGPEQNLFNISDFDASASYDITDRWSVSLRAENMLNHIYYLGPAIPCQGFRMMAGVSYKF